MKTFDSNNDQMVAQAHGRPSGESIKSRNRGATWAPAVLAILALLGAGCAGGGDSPQSRSKDAVFSHQREPDAQAAQVRPEPQEQDPFQDIYSRRPVGQTHNARSAAPGDAYSRRVALQQMEELRDQQAYRAAQAQWAEAWNRAIVMAAWQQAMQQQTLSGQGGSQGNQGQHRVLSTYDLTGTAVYDGVGVMTPNGSWYPGQ